MKNSAFIQNPFFILRECCWHAKTPDYWNFNILDVCVCVCVWCVSVCVRVYALFCGRVINNPQRSDQPPNKTHPVCAVAAYVQ